MRHFMDIVHDRMRSTLWIVGVDAVIARGYVDPDNLFVPGGSDGGALTARIVGKTDRFRAAVPCC